MKSSNRYAVRHAGGFILVEALIAFVLLAAGLLAVLGFHGVTQKINSEARVQAEAVALAEAKLQELRSFLTATDARLDNGNGGDAPQGRIVIFNRTWGIASDDTNPELVNVLVTVGWEDRHGIGQNVILASAIYRKDPASNIANFLALAHKTQSAAASTAYWSDSDSVVQDEFSPVEPSLPDDSENPGIPDPDSGPEVEVTVYELAISGAISGGPGNVSLDADIENASIDAYLIYPASCTTPTSRTFSCTVKYSNRSAGWSGEIELSVNRIFCQTLSSRIVLTFAGLTSNQTGISLVVGNNANQCS